MPSPAPSTGATYVAPGVPKRPADVAFTQTVNQARSTFRAALCEHTLVDAQSLDHVLAVFDESVADISTAIIARIRATP